MFRFLHEKNFINFFKKEEKLIKSNIKVRKRKGEILEKAKSAKKRRKKEKKEKRYKFFICFTALLFFLSALRIIIFTFYSCGYTITLFFP